MLSRKTRGKWSRAVDTKFRDLYSVILIKEPPGGRDGTGFNTRIRHVMYAYISIGYKLLVVEIL